MKIKLLTFVMCLLLFSTIVVACGERDVKLVDEVSDYETTTVKSACSKVRVEVDEDDVVLVSKDRIEITQHTAEEILQNYIEEDGNKLSIVYDDHSDVPGHEEHTHTAGKLQDSHGTISYAFLVRGGEDFHEGNSVPFYVDAETGEVYGIGCGYGAGKVVYSPDLGEYGNFFQKVKHWFDYEVFN